LRNGCAWKPPALRAIGAGDRPGNALASRTAGTSARGRMRAGNENGATVVAPFSFPMKW
jgi:hypothetical protein